LEKKKQVWEEQMKIKETAKKRADADADFVIPGDLDDELNDQNIQPEDDTSGSKKKSKKPRVIHLLLLLFSFSFFKFDFF